ncbi:MAG: TonB-dependent receptor [Kofleriaceae bacterium]|nr:TonB-dependent receptor [Kofleriaceae bacterium]
MRLAALLVVVSLAQVARADGIPGTGDDPLHEVEMSTSTADAPLLDGMSIRGGSAADTLVLLDGFEVPYIWHGHHLRSVVSPGIVGASVVTDGTDLAFGRAPSFVNIQTDPWSPRFSDASVSVLDARIGGRQPLFRSRTMGAGTVRHSLLDRVADDRYLDALVRIDHRIGERWTLELTSFLSIDDGSDDDRDLREVVGHREASRTIVGARYRGRMVDVWLAVSGLTSYRELERGVQHVRDKRDSIDTRIIATRRWSDAGALSRFEWTVGSETNAGYHDLDIAMPREARDGSPQSPMPDPGDTSTTFRGTFWTPDVAVYTSAVAGIGHDVLITGGVRVDRFGRGNDIATQPRGAIDYFFTKNLGARLSAGAYRRPPQSGEELLYPYLHPERTTQVAATLHQRISPVSDAYLTAFYIDRSQLIVRDRATDALVNTGRGRSYGIEAMINGQLGNWFGAANASLSKSTRVDYERGPERPSDLDQPFKLDAMAGYRGKKKNWQVAARVQLYSGLPVTPISAGVYNADRDHYDPLFGETNTERLPFHHQVDLRLDRVFRIKDRVSLAAVVDVANVYAAKTPIGYDYSYDYRERLDVRLPIVPYVGVTLRFDE